MVAPSYSLVTYTYNDAAILAGLLESVPRWTLRPTEIIVVDDGSDRPPDLPALPGLPVPLLLANRVNQGPAITKSRGITAARQAYVLSIDCDIRLDEAWVERALPEAADPGVGLVSSALRQRATDDFASQYFSIYGDNFNTGPDRAVDFLTGGVWLLRADVWRAVGGVRGYAERLGVDHAYCAVLRRYGYAMRVVPGIEAWQVRQLSRRAMANKIWGWFRGQALACLPEAADFWDFALAYFAPQAYERIDEHLGRRRFAFLYMEILYVANALRDLLGQGLAQKNYPLSLPAAFDAATKAAFRDCPHLLAFLDHDLPGGLAKGEPTVPVPFWEDFLGLLRRAGVLTLVEAALARRRDTLTRPGDASMYERLPGGPPR